jgi:hypothetical protein
MTRERTTTFKQPTEHDSLDKVRHIKPQTSKRDTSDLETRRLAEESGFNARVAVAAGTIDARSLRRTNRTAQLNLSVTTDTKNRFWAFAQENGFSVGEEALIELLKQADRGDREEL